MKDIIQLTGSSRDTARRDILKLADHHMVERNYGGISLPHSLNKLDEFLDRMNDFNQEKQQLAQLASHLINESDFIYLDVSTTINFLPPYLKNIPDLFAVTNALDIADNLLRFTTCKTRILGGTLDRETRCVIGTKALYELDDYKFDIAFLSVAGLDKNGVYYAYEEDNEFKKKIRQQAKKVVLLIDEEKVNVTHNFKVYDFEDIDTIISNKPFPSELHQLLAHKNVDLIYVEEDKYD